MIYDLLAPVYDEINKEIDYTSWADFIERIIKKEYKLGNAKLVLDLGCGTGSMTLELAARGYDMTGVDYSVEMLDIAMSRARERRLDGKVLWLCQDMCAFELYGTVEVVVSCLDCINHLDSTKKLGACLSLVHNYLSPDGLFIFDVNGKYKFENVYSDKSYVMETDRSVCIWQNYYNPRTKLCDFYITLFNETGAGTYERYDEVQRERMYTLSYLERALAGAGFEFIGAYSDYDFTEATDKDERIYVVARCKKENLS